MGLKYRSVCFFQIHLWLTFSFTSGLHVKFIYSEKATKGPGAKKATRKSPGYFNQILNFESWKWSPVATFESWNNKSGLSFFDFQLFHVQKQVLSQIVIFLGHFFPLHFPIHLPVILTLLKYNIGIFAWYLDYSNPESLKILTMFRLIIHPSTVAPHYFRSFFPRFHL